MFINECHVFKQKTFVWNKIGGKHAYLLESLKINPYMYIYTDVLVHWYCAVLHSAQFRLLMNFHRAVALSRSLSLSPSPSRECVYARGARVGGAWRGGLQVVARSRQRAVGRVVADAAARLLVCVTTAAADLPVGVPPDVIKTRLLRLHKREHAEHAHAEERKKHELGYKHKFRTLYYAIWIKRLSP